MPALAVNQNKRLPSPIIATDRAALLALKQLDDYAPANAAIAIDALNALEAQLRQAEEAEILAGKAFKAARSAWIAADCASPGGSL